MFYNNSSNYNSDYSSLRKNAYVGGDAYNYIINAEYFSGYVSLGGCLFITSSLYAIEGIKILKNKE